MSAKELNIGDYVRTKKGTIYKFNSKSNMAKNGAKKYMVKSSPNIIDLIEVGDYVNGFKVLEVFKNDIPGESIIAFENHNKYLSSIYDDEIKSIVTKEQFENMKYDVK